MVYFGPPMIVISLFVFLSLRIQNLITLELLFLIIGDVCNQLYIFAELDYWTIFKKEHGLAFIMVILQMLFVFFWLRE